MPLTGIHLLRTGEVQADLSVLNQDARLSHVDELIAQKRGGGEQGTLDPRALAWHAGEYERLLGGLRGAVATSPLPAALPDDVGRALHDLVCTRLS